MVVPALAVAATVFYAVWVNQTFPVRHWLFFLYLKYWLFIALFAAASTASGWRLSRKLVDVAPLGERWLLAFGLGVLLFVLGIFVGGLLALLGPVFFFAWPAALLAYGGPSLWHDARRARRHLARFGARLFLPGTALQTLAALLLLGSVLAIYLQVITPANLGADTYWYHLPVAEHYAAAGKIRAFADGWYLGTYPQLASILYTWAFIAPGTLFDHVALSSHLEFALFVATLPGIAVFTRRLLVDTRAPFAGAALFLFPAIYLYDSSLNTGADHVLAFWVPLLGVAMARMLRRFDAKEAILAACFMAGALLTKHQGIYFVPPVGLLLVVLAVRRRALRPLLIFCGACLLLTAPHWLKNWVFYGDPEYPLLHAFFRSHPFHARASAQTFFADQFMVHGTPLDKLGQTLTALVNFGLIPHDWAFHRDRPVVGALFTLLLPMLLVVRPRRPLVLTVIAVHLGLATWFMIMHQDRYLQALMPWIAAVTAALLILGWRQGWLARLTLAGLVGLQIVWGADVYFIRSHGMIGDSVLKATVDYLASGHQGRYKERFRIPGSLEQVAARLPRGAKVMQHEVQGKLGLGAQAICDMPEWQGALEYLLQDVPADVERLWRDLGATHVMWTRGKGPGWAGDKLAREVVFHRSIEPFVDSATDVDDFRLLTLPPRGSVPVPTDRTIIAWLSCASDPPSALYTAAGLEVGTPMSPLAPAAVRDATQATLASANAIVLRASCPYWGGNDAALGAIGFRHRYQAGEYQIWIRGAQPAR